MGAWGLIVFSTFPWRTTKRGSTGSSTKRLGVFTSRKCFEPFDDEELNIFGDPTGTGRSEDRVVESVFAGVGSRLKILGGGGVLMIGVG